jgi:hypothetical protein
LTSDDWVHDPTIKKAATLVGGGLVAGAIYFAIL